MTEIVVLLGVVALVGLFLAWCLSDNDPQTDEEIFRWL